MIQVTQINRKQDFILYYPSENCSRLLKIIEAVYFHPFFSVLQVLVHLYTYKGALY